MDTAQRAGYLLTNSRYAEAAGVLIEFNMNEHRVSTSQKRKRTKSKELSDLVCADFVTDHYYLWLIETRIIPSRKFGQQSIANL